MTNWQTWREWSFNSGLEGWSGENYNTQAPYTTGGEVRFDYLPSVGGSQYGRLKIGVGPGGSLEPGDQIVHGRYSISFVVGWTGAEGSFKVGTVSNQAAPVGNGPYVRVLPNEYRWPTTGAEGSKTPVEDPIGDLTVTFIYDSDNEAMEQFVVSSGNWAYGYPLPVIMPWDVSPTPNGGVYGTGQVYVEFTGLQSGAFYIKNVKIEKAATGTEYDAPLIYLGGTTGAYDGTIEVYDQLAGARLSTIGWVTQFHMRSPHHYENSEVVIVNAPVDCEVSRDGITYGATASYPAGSIGDKNVPCWIRRIGETVTRPTWTDLLLTPRRALIPTRLQQ